MCACTELHPDLLDVDVDGASEGGLGLQDTYIYNAMVCVYGAPACLPGRCMLMVSLREG